MEGTAVWIFAAGASERSPPSQFLSPASSDQLLGNAIRHPTVEVAKYLLMSQLGLWLRQSHSPWLLAAPVHVSTQPCCRKSPWQTQSAEANHLQNQTQFFRTLILSLRIRTKDTQTGGCNVRAADASNPCFHTLTFTVCGDAVPADRRGQAFYCLHKVSFDLCPCEKGPAWAKEI